MFNRINTKFQRFAMLLVAILLVNLPKSASALGIGSDLEAAATTAISALLVTIGVVLVAAFAIPVAKKTYRIISGALGAAS